MAWTGKPHTIVEDLILPAAADMAVTMLGEKAKKTIQTTSQSNNTVSQSISDMAGDILKQLLPCIEASKFYELQLESTDMAGLAQLLVYVRYVYGGQLRKLRHPLLQATGNQDNRRGYFLKYWTAL
jgi:hypothetical protein